MKAIRTTLIILVGALLISLAGCASGTSTASGDKSKSAPASGLIVTDRLPAKIHAPESLRAESGVQRMLRQLPAEVQVEYIAGNQASFAEPKCNRLEGLVYPVRLLLKRVGGVVQALAIIDADGKAKGVFILSSPDPLFSDSVCAALFASKFQPARLDGKAVAAMVLSPIVFRTQ